MDEEIKPNIEVIPVEIPTNTSEDIDYSKEYRDRMNDQVEELERVRNYDENMLNVGPRYSLRTSKGEPLMVDTIYFDYKDKQGTQHRKYYMVAQDTNGRVVGDRFTTVKELEYKGDRYALAEGR